MDAVNNDVMVHGMVSREGVSTVWVFLVLEQALLRRGYVSGLICVWHGA